MKICVIGAPSTGKSVFAKSLAAELSRRGHSTELVQEYPSRYLQEVGAPKYAWEQLAISIGQYEAEQQTTRDHLVTDGAAFATYIYAQRLIPKRASDTDWPRYRHLLDVLRQLARHSVSSYDLIFLLTHIFPPQDDGVRAKEHLSRHVCQAIGRDLEAYLQTERVEHHRLKANDTHALEKALNLIEQRLLIQSPVRAQA